MPRADAKQRVIWAKNDRVWVQARKRRVVSLLPLPPAPARKGASRAAGPASFPAGTRQFRSRNMLDSEGF